MKILVSGAAGFIGFHVCKKLLELGYQVAGIDNLNDYYDISLKKDRLQSLGIHLQADNHSVYHSSTHPSFTFYRYDICDEILIRRLFQEEPNIAVVCHLAAQAGVRYSLQNPAAYIDTNIRGFFNVINTAAAHNIRLLMYASSSSVYGEQQQKPFAETDDTEHPISIYAATKKSNEILAYTYSHLYNLPTMGLRFFTVYGPWGRPDMAMYRFCKAICEHQTIELYNQGNLYRDFTYIDDVVAGIVNLMQKALTNLEQHQCIMPEEKITPNYTLMNIGNTQPILVKSLINLLENVLEQKADIKYLPMQAGEVSNTWADTEKIFRYCGFKPTTPLAKGIQQYAEWFLQYYYPQKYPIYH